MKQSAILFVTSSMLLALLLGACRGGMTDDEKAIAIAVALTQTAAAPQATPPLAATPAPTATAAVSLAAPVGDAPALPMPQLPITPAVAPTSAPAAVEPTAQTPPVVQAAAAPGSGEPLPITQSAAKVRNLLVAPGEPGALYALLTDEISDNAPAQNAQLLLSRDFGANWEAAPSGLPHLEEAGAGDCLYNVSMDYYGATALFAGTCQGLYRWSAAEPTWTQVSTATIGMVAVTYGNADLIWATRPYQPDEAPLLRSQDGGTTWTAVAMTHTTGIANIGINPRDSRTGYAIVWPDEEPGSDLRRGSLFTDWQIMPGPNANQAINTGMTIDGGTGALYVTTRDAAGARLWYTTNGDTSNIANVQWEERYGTVAGVNLELLASGWSPDEDQIAIYANFTQIVNDALIYALYRSLDSGHTWAPLVIAEE